jgi:hypothetical protein
MSIRTIKAMAIAAMVSALSLVGIAYAQDATNYDYVTQVTVANTTGSAITNTAVLVPINAANLVAGGYLAADGQDIYAEVGGVESLLTAQIEASDPSNWWMPVVSLADNATAAYAVYTGQNTTTADNPQSLFLQATTETATAANDASLNIANKITIQIDNIKFSQYPGSALPFLSYHSGANTGWVVGLNSTGHVFITTGRFTDGDVGTTGVTALSLNTEYDLTFYVDTTLTPQMIIKVDNATDGNDASSANNIAYAGNEKVQLTPPAGFMYVDRVRIGDTSLSSPTWQLDWQFEPDQMSQTRAGISGNSWNWLGTITDESVNTNTGNYTFVRDTTGVTVTVGAMGLVSPSVSTAGETEITVVSGTVTTPVGNPYTNPNTTADFGFPFNILAISAQAGSVPLQLLAMTIVLVGGVAMGLWVFKATRMTGVAILSAAVATGMLIFLTPVTNMVMLLVVIPSLALVVLLPQPFEAR